MSRVCRRSCLAACPSRPSVKSRYRGVQPQVDPGRAEGRPRLPGQSVRVRSSMTVSGKIVSGA